MGYESFDYVMKKGVVVFSLWEFEIVVNEMDVLILDVWDKVIFVKGFIFNLIFIGLDGSFVFWVGVLIVDLM